MATTIVQNRRFMEVANIDRKEEKKKPQPIQEITNIQQNTSIIVCCNCNSFCNLSLIRILVSRVIDSVYGVSDGKICVYVDVYIGNVVVPIGIFIFYLSTSFPNISSRSESSVPGFTPICSSPIQVDGESFERTMSSSRKNEYTAVLFYASWCPFSGIFQSKFSTLSSMYPQIKHVMVEQASVVPSVFSRYGIHSVPSLLIVNQTKRMRYHGRKDLSSLVNFYRKATGMDPVVDMVEDTSHDSNIDQKVFHRRDGASLKEILLSEPYVLLSAVFLLSRALLYFFPEIASRLMAMWVAYIPHLNMEIFGESRQLIGRVLHLIDVERIWSKLKLCKTRNFHKGARNAQAWASSLASVSVFPSRDL